LGCLGNYLVRTVVDNSSSYLLIVPNPSESAGSGLNEGIRGINPSESAGSGLEAGMGAELPGRNLTPFK
jgi:hypothetical protein